MGENQKKLLLSVLLLVVIVFAALFTRSRVRGPVLDSSERMPPDAVRLMELDTRLTMEWDQLSSAEREAIQKEIDELNEKLGYTE